ncbi:hypothetical protein yc1106_02305 [Curvularia clavata]|uniref:Zn(2)-C6 fungal-type domain-containing protein n=1 Tax=Curvularia clavata TaxID=95742 RepID=A0A9Q8Z337_CURCL|nr:hypothetical protein yc1106_02305 [Curvularia clavata]
MESLHRSACDECHDRKIKCTTNAPGACLNCQGTGRVCIFSPRDEMGRPRKAGRRAKDRSAADKTSSRSAAQKRASVSEKREEQRPLTPARSCSQSDLGALPQPAQHDTFQLPDNDFDMMSQHDFTFILENQAANFSTSASLPYSPSNDSSMNYFQHHNHVPKPEPLLLTPPISEHSKVPDKSLGLLPHTDGSGLPLDVYRQLSRLLFILRQECNRPWCIPGIYGTEEYVVRPGKEVFESASSLCDILHAVISGKSSENETIRPQHPMDHEDTHAMFVLALMGVAMLLDIYRLLGRTHSWAASPNPDCTDLAVAGQTPGPGTGGGPTTNILHHPMDPSGGSMGAGRSVTANHLTSILQLTTMDFHLARLASMLSDLSGGRDAIIGMQRAMKPLGGLEVSELLVEIKRTREEMRGSADSLLVKA